MGWSQSVGAPVTPMLLLPKRTRRSSRRSVSPRRKRRWKVAWKLYDCFGNAGDRREFPESQAELQFKPPPCISCTVLYVGLQIHRAKDAKPPNRAALETQERWDFMMYEGRISCVIRLAPVSK